jgi:hypothetical protein
MTLILGVESPEPYAYQNTDGTVTPTCEPNPYSFSRVPIIKSKALLSGLPHGTVSQAVSQIVGVNVQASSTAWNLRHLENLPGLRAF